jgi:DNA polymerase-3 subunit gamma/tau
MTEEISDLYRKYRPTKFEDVVGQDQAVTVLQNKLQTENLPHVVLFSGPTGSGKNTLAYIVRNDLGCTDANFIEINCAEVRGIDSVRELYDAIGYKPMAGKCRVWLFDEVVQLPKATQQAFLQVLEKCPAHVYFLLCTSDTTGLLPTFLGRCFIVNLEPLGSRALTKIVESVCEQLEVELPGKVLAAIVTNSGGSGRRALQLLEAVTAVEDDEETQLAVVTLSSAKEEEKVEFLATALMKRAKWSSLVPIIQSVTDPEKMRHQLLAYASKIMASGSPDKSMAYLLIRTCQGSWREDGIAALWAAAWAACLKKD